MRGAEGLRGAGPLGLSWGIQGLPGLSQAAGCVEKPSGRFCLVLVAQPVLVSSWEQGNPSLPLGWGTGLGGGRGALVPAQAFLCTGAGAPHPTGCSCQPLAPCHLPAGTGLRRCSGAPAGPTGWHCPCQGPAAARAGLAAAAGPRSWRDSCEL